MNVIDELRAKGLITSKSKTTKIKEVSREKLEKQVARDNAELQRAARVPEELIIPVRAKIVDVIYSGSTDNCFCPASEAVMGGRSSNHPIGDYYSCVIHVQSDTPVKEVRFIGWPALFLDDTIDAYVFAGEQKWKNYVRESQFGGFVVENIGEKREGEPPRFSSDYGLKQGENAFVYVQRELKSIERAVRIDKINRTGGRIASWIDSKARDSIPKTK
jgi:hypothetical protein